LFLVVQPFASQFPPADARDVWAALTDPASAGYNHTDAVHASIVTSREVLLKGDMKLLTAQPLFKSQNNGWKMPNGTWDKSNDALWPCNQQDKAPKEDYYPGAGSSSSTGTLPCLFNITADPEERHNLATTMPDVVQAMWQELNRTVLTFRDCEGWMGPVPGPGGSCSPAALKGSCNASCADAHWRTAYPGGGAGDQGPLCGVPGCQ